jgi:hypothetical protein
MERREQKFTNYPLPRVSSEVVDELISRKLHLLKPDYFFGPLDELAWGSDDVKDAINEISRDEPKTSKLILLGMQAVTEPFFDLSVPFDVERMKHQSTEHTKSKLKFIFKEFLDPEKYVNNDALSETQTDLFSYIEIVRANNPISKDQPDEDGYFDRGVAIGYRVIELYSENGSQF